MKYVVKDEAYKYYYCFDSSSGFYYRSNIIKNGVVTQEEPYMSSFPHLIDVGVMGTCKTGVLGLCNTSGIQCYQNGGIIKKPNMSVIDFERICKECTGKTFQFAFGGRGDPDTHEFFEDLLKCSVNNSIVPNLTSSGVFLNDETVTLCKKYCGAVAISWHKSKYTYKSIEALIKAGVKTNVHFVLKASSIKDAVELLKNNMFPKGINAVIFLLHKPAGQGIPSQVISIHNPYLNEFYDLVKKHDASKYKIGFDSCSVPGLITHLDTSYSSLDACEAGRFSCYIDSELNMTPCSFDVKQKYSQSLINSTIEEVWNSEEFSNFRNKALTSCSSCKYKSVCIGGCQLFDSINLCHE